MPPERQITLPGIWAESAQTTVPSPPTPGVAYRNAGMSSDDWNKGQAYAQGLDSAIWNQKDYAISALLKAIEQNGVLPWSSLTTYQPQAFCMGLDGVLYVANRSSGPESPSGPQTPGDDEEYWKSYADIIAEAVIAELPEVPLAEEPSEEHPGGVAGVVVPDGVGLVINSGTTLLGVSEEIKEAVGALPGIVNSLAHKLDTIHAFGVGQVWQSVSDRSLNTNYTNTEGKPIMVSVFMNFAPQAGSALKLVVGGVQIQSLWIGSGGPSGTGRLCVSGVVPQGATYRVETSGTPVSGSLTWRELR